MFETYNDASSFVANNSLPGSVMIIDGCTNDANLPNLNSKEIKKVRVKTDNSKIQTIDSPANKDKFIKGESFNNQKLLETIFKQKPEDKEILDHYSFTNYFQRLIKEDEALENSYYENELEKINQLIREDTYNSNIFFSAESRVSKDVTDADTTKNHNSSINLNWEHRLYDGQKSYVFNQIKKIKEQGAQIEYEDAKNNLALIGADLYGNVLFTQTVINIYNDLYNSQENLYEIIYENRKDGLVSVVDELDAKFDLIELKKQLVDYQVIHARNSFLLKQSINSKSNKEVYVSPFNISRANYSKKEEKSLVLHNNPQIAIAQNRLKDEKVSILNESARRMPIVDLDASTGYGWSEDLITNNKEDGFNWDVGVTVNIPIYERNDIYLNEQRAKVVALQAKNDLRLTIKNALSNWDNHKKTTKRLNTLKELLKKQLIGQKEKLNIIRKKYLEGKSDYRDYADALNKITLVSVDLVNNLILLEKEKIIGNYLLGKKIYNVKN